MTTKWIRYLVYLSLTVFISWIYGPHVSPEVGLGPSGIITLAVASGGLAPVPGYPVHGLISRLFLSVPDLSPAYAMNIGGFAMAVLSVLLLTRLLVILTAAATRQSVNGLWIGIAGLASALVYFYSPGLARISYFADRYTTELFFVFCALNIAADAVLHSAKLRRGMIFMSFLLSFIFFCHPKSLPLIFVLWCLVGIRARVGRVAWPWKSMIGGLLLGLLPVLYLPMVSRTGPLFDWGNPETLQSVIHSLTRREYSGISILRPFSEWMIDWSRQYRLLSAQFSVVVLGLAVLGVVGAFVKNWRWGAVLLLVLLVLGEGTTWLQHYHNPSGSVIHSQMFDWYMINYYGPYFTWVILLSCLVPLFVFARLQQSWQKATATGLILALVVGHGFLNAKNSYKDYALNEETLANIEALLPRGAILFTNVDSLFSILVYKQIHNGRLPDRYILHSELMFRTWYYDDLKRLYPKLWHRHIGSFEALKQIFAEFEASGFDDKNFNMADYYKQLNAMAAANMESGSYIFLDPEVQPLRPRLFRDFNWDPEGLAFRLVRGSFRVNDLSYNEIRFTALLKQSARVDDFWARRFRVVYEAGFAARLKRATMLQSQEVPQLEEILSKLKN